MEERKERSIEERIEQTSEGRKERKGKQGRRKEGRKEGISNQSQFRRLFCLYPTEVAHFGFKMPF